MTKETLKYNNSVYHKCDCCSSVMYEDKDYEIYRHSICDKCGHERFHVKLGTSNNESYENDLDYQADLDISSNYNDLIQWSHVKAINSLRDQKISNNSSILDIGCFNGFFVKKLKDLCFDAHGIDFNAKAIEYGEIKYGLVGFISTDSLDDKINQGALYDVITMFEVIEHLEDFRSFIEKALKLLKKNGIFIISTPNSNMIWRPDLDHPPHHLSRFTPHSLRCLIETFELDFILQHEQSSSFDFIRNYLGSLMREKSITSMRGGAFREKRYSNFLRILANRLKWMIYLFLKPVDIFLKMLGFRYISQIIVAKKI